MSEQIQTTVTEFAKSQHVRLFDVVMLGPWLIYLATKSSLSKNERIALGIAGAGTILYNLNNYLKNR